MTAQATIDSKLNQPGLTDQQLLEWRRLPAAQQPKWADSALAARALTELTGLPGLVGVDEIDALSDQLALVAGGQRLVVQAGDCAEDLAHSGPAELAPKLSLLAELGRQLSGGSGLPVVTVGRLAGQFAKPRSHPEEMIGDLRLPAFRGQLINGAEPDPLARRHDPRRLLAGYRAAATALSFLRSHAPGTWTSHDALVLDYELPLLRRAADGRLLLSSTHWPWIGERTRQLDGAHLRLLASIGNPVACKVGPNATANDLLALCERLDPGRRPGRLTLIARQGAGVTARRLPALVTAVRTACYPVIWLCDPMHANTVRTPSGHKSRVFDTVACEIVEFRAAVEDGGGVAGGLHLEVTPDEVTECVWSSDQLADVDGSRYSSLCDPRLNAEQALAAARQWTAAGS